MKKIISILLTVALTLSVLSCMCFAAPFALIECPAVFIVGDSYNILWTTTSGISSTGYVKYIYDGIEYIVYDEDNGVVRSDDYIHVVTVPKEHLDGAGAYTVYSTQVNSRSAYGMDLGSTVSSGKISFRGYSKDDADINIFTVSDTHMTDNEKIQVVLDSVAHLKGEPDLLVLNGDITNTMNYLNDLVIRIIPLVNSITNGEIPAVYVRGNHESHGADAGALDKYFTDENGELYKTFTYGPMAGLTLEFGEDKPDSYPGFKGVVDYNSQFAEQVTWLENLGGYGNDDTVYRLAFCHGGSIRNQYGFDMMKPLDAYGTDLLVVGHNHQLELRYPAGFRGEGDPDLTTPDETWLENGVSAEWGYDVPVLVDGSETTDNNGVTTFNTSQVILSGGKIFIYGIAETAEDVYEAKIDCSFNAGRNPIDESYAPEGNDYYLQNAVNSTADTFIPGFHSSESELLDTSSYFKFTTKPTVFDTGDTYTIAWATTEGQSATGEVYVEYKGSILRFTDNGSGPMRINNNAYSYASGKKHLNSVEIPKKYLENNKYKVISRHIVNPYYLEMDKGSSIETGWIQFNGYSGQTDINMLVCSDLAASDTLYSQIKALNTDYDMLIINGNIMSNVESSSNVANQLLYVSGNLTGGKIPTVFVRGDNETLGEFAPYLSEVISASTNEYYTQINYGPVSAVVLDTAASQYDSEYNGTATFAGMRANQKTWLSKISYGDAQYKIAFSNNGELYDYLDSNYARDLNNLGTDLLITGSADNSEFEELGNRNQNYAVANNGKADGTVATLINFSDGNITVTPLDSEGRAISINTVPVSDNDVGSYSDVDLDSWYSPAVSYTSKQRIMLGTAPDTFAPESTLTRAMAVTALARLANAELEGCSTDVFEDVDADSYYASAVAWAYENRITLGTSETTFSPNSTITREQLCTMFYRMYKDEPGAADSCDFIDCDSISDYAKTAVHALYSAGIIDGVGDGRFEPKHTVTRAQLAQIIYKSGF